MPARDEASIRLNSAYSWPNLDLSTLGRLAKGAIAEFAGGFELFKGSIRRPGTPEATEEYRSVDEWISALSNQDGSFDFWLPSSDYKRTVRLAVALPGRETTVTIESPLSEQAEAKNLVREIEKELGLAATPAAVVQTEEPKKWSIQFEEQYKKQKPPSADWCAKAADLFWQHVGEQAFFSGSFRLLSAPAYVRNYQEIGTWKSDLNRSWQEVSEVTFSLRRNNRSVGLRCNFDRSEANLSVSSDLQEEVDAWVGSVKQDLELLAGTAAQAPELQGEKRQYYTQDRLDWQWFEQAISTIRSFAQRPIYFNGRFSLGAANVERSYGTVDSWQTDLAAKWGEVRTTYCWISTSHSRVLFECDVLREQVRLDIQSVTWSDVDRIFQTLESKLSLKRIEGVPYRYRSYAKVYGFDEWEPGRDNEAFAQAVDESIAKAFPKSPVVVNAYLTEGELSETLKPAYELADFVKAARDPAKKWQVINLYVEGSKGWMLGITVNVKSKRLELRSSLEQASFSTVLEVFRGKIALEFKENLKLPKPVKEKGEAFWSKATIAVLGALLTVASGSMAVWFNSRSHYSLQVTSPKVEAGKAAQVPARGLYVDWLLTKDPLFGERSIVSGRPARVRIFGKSDSAPKTDAIVSPGLVTVSPGDRRIEVAYPELGLVSAADIVVENQQDKVLWNQPDNSSKKRTPVRPSSATGSQR